MIGIIYNIVFYLCTDKKINNLKVYQNGQNYAVLRKHIVKNNLIINNIYLLEKVLIVNINLSCNTFWLLTYKLN